MYKKTKVGAAAVAVVAALVAAPVAVGPTLLSSAQAATFQTFFDGQVTIGQRVNSSVGTTSGGQVYVLGFGDSQFTQRTEVYYYNNTRTIYARADGPTGAGFTTAYTQSPKVDSVSRCYFFDPFAQFTSGMSSGMKCTVLR